jgi:hypothetical protein
MTNPNDSAFSKSAFYHPDGGLDVPQEGLSKREYFAAMALQGFFAAAHHSDTDVEYFAPIAVQAADALIAELNKQPNHDTPNN